jgi:signal transduction histidine kinase
MRRMCPAAVSKGAWARPGLARAGVAVTLAGWVIGLLVTALILWSPYLTSGVRSPSLHLMLDTTDACIALLVAYLMHARFVRRRYWQDRFLAQGLVLLAVAGLGLASVAERLSEGQAGALDIWLPLTIRLAGALCIVVAALADGRPVRHGFAQRYAWLLPLTLVVVVSSGLWISSSDLPVAFDSASIRTSAERPLLTGHPALLVAQAFSALCFFVASIAFAFQSARRDDELLRWLGPAFALAGFARVNYLLFPSLYTDWLYTGDLLRTGCYLLLLVGAGREIRQYWTAQSRAAVLEDRRRLARELHDGVIQELGYIRSEGFTLPADLPAGDRIIAACDRGLDEARAAVQALGRPTDEPLGFVLHRAARELAERYQVDLEAEVDYSISVQPDQQHALMRITREAVSNAIRHGKAQRIQVQLAQCGGQRRLMVQDDGQGFDADRAVADNAGYGLVSMRDRARSLPGSLTIDSNPGSGSVVTVTW